MLVKKKTLQWAVLIFSITAGMGIATLNFVPAWQNIKNYTVFSLILLPFIYYLINLWIKNYRNRKLLKISQWITSVFITIVLGFIFIIFYFVASLSGFDDPEPHELKLKNYTFYVYENGCWVPDSNCECDYYRSMIYLQNKYLPIMHLKKVVNFYVGDIQFVGDKLIVKATEDCQRDHNKQVEISLE